MKPGDRIVVQTKEETLEGVLVPAPDLENSVVILKLDSGYNIGIDKKRVTRMKLVATARPVKLAASVAPAQARRLPKISILHTGGTIASKVDYRTGGVVAQFSADEMLRLFPELVGIASVSSRQIARFSSELLRMAHFNLFAKEIAREVKNGADGIILTHGTDTMHYTAAALSFMFSSLPVPVILVGAQRSSDRGSSDAAVNLLSAAYFITNSDFSGVAICMHENSSDDSCLILPGTKTRKMHTSRRDAFRPINTTAIARVSRDAGRISFLQKEYPKRGTAGMAPLRLFKDTLKISILKAHPHMNASQVLFFKGYDGLVLEGTGLGHFPNEQVDDCTAENRKIQAAIAALIKSGVVVVMASQALYGRLQMQVYSPGRTLLEAGVIGNYSDMTPETTFVKLAWLLSNYKKDDVKKLIMKNLRGELNERIEKRTFLV